MGGRRPAPERDDAKPHAVPDQGRVGAGEELGRGRPADAEGPRDPRPRSLEDQALPSEGRNAGSSPAGDAVRSVHEHDMEKAERAGDARGRPFGTPGRSELLARLGVGGWGPGSDGPHHVRDRRRGVPEAVVVKRAKSWGRVKKDWPGRPCVKASVFVPVEDSEDGLEVSIEGTVPKGLAMLLAVSGLTKEPMTPEMDLHLLDLAKRMILGTA